MKRLLICLVLVCLLFPFLSFAQQKSENSIRSIVVSQLDNKSNQSEDIHIKVHDFHKSSASKLEHYYFKQSLSGIEIQGTESSVHLKTDGTVFKFNNKLVLGLSNANKASTQPNLNPLQAIEYAGRHLGYTTPGTLKVIEHSSLTNKKQLVSKGQISRVDIPAKLVYSLSGNNHLSLAWDISIYETQKEEWWSMRVDASTGEIIDKVSWIVHCNFDHGNGAHTCTNHSKNTKQKFDNFLEEKVEKESFVGGYRVYPMPLAHPGEGSRVLINNPDNAVASPFGWHDTNGATGAEFTTTQGNNVHAFDDGNNVGYSVDGGSGLLFDFPLDLNQDPENFEDAALTNLFYWNNIAHDVLYQYGFDETSGNFQENNYGNGGAASDHVNARSQIDLWCNATFGTPPDGSNPTMSMYICNGRDGDYSNAVILHEYAHGLSNRLTGGPSASGCLGNAEQMGEGWSDYLGLILTMKSGDQATTARPIGDWLFNDPGGIRPYPYSTDMTVNPHTYANSFSGTSQPHGIGSVWCMMTWEMTWDLIGQYGFDTDFYNGNGGNNIALQLVVEGLKLQPCSPGFVDGRDAILAADQALYGGANQCLIWGAFSKRGLGVNADQGSSANRSDGVEAFNLPSACGGTGCLLKINGSKTVLLPHTASTNIIDVESDGNWTVTSTGSWISLNTTSGSGNASISYNVPANPTFSSRTDTIKFTCTGFTLKYVVTQEAKPCIQLYTSIPYSTGFESGALDNFWCTTSSEPGGRVQVTDLFEPRGTRHLVLDRTVSGEFTVNEAKLGVQLAGASNVELRFWWKEFNDETHPEDGVFLSDDAGASYIKVFDFTSGNPTYAQVALNLTQLAIDNGLTLTNTFIIKFQQYDNFPANTDGIGIDDVSVLSISCVVGSPCNDNDPCTINDVYTTTCACLGTFQDADNDGVCDANDQCPGSDDTIDLDADGIPDGCDQVIFCGDCNTTITTYPHIEDFEIGEGEICQYSGDDFDWTINSGSTTSLNTGPDSAYQGVNYFYGETSAPNFPSKVTAFESGCYDLSGSNTATINFWYHMYGVEMGTLNLEVTTTQGTNWTSIWSLSGDQGTNWMNVNIDISTYTGGLLSYRFTGTSANSFTSDFSLDQITVDIGVLNCTPGSACNDNDPCTINDVYNATCVCVGTFEDTDNDGVCDANDQCPGSDDSIDLDGDGTPDGCDQNVYCGACNVSITSYPHTEDFETGEGEICQYTGDDFDWLIRSDSTFSVNTGPDSAYQGINYFYIESSIPNYPDKVSAFQSGCYDLSSAGTASIDFWFHMYGASMGTLELQVTTDQGSNWTSVWSLSGNQGDAWLNATVDLTNYIGGSLSYRFTGNTLTSFTSDIALDQITVDVGAVTENRICNASSPVIIDGNTTDWNANDTLFEPTILMDGTIGSPTDFSSLFQVKWDDNHLYVLGMVQDETLVNDSPDPWHDDSFEIFIDGGNEKGTSYDANDHQLIFRYDDLNVYEVGNPTNPAGVDFKMIEGNDFYNVEVRISWAFIGIAAPTVGDKIGFEIHVNDDDDGGVRDAGVSWSDPNNEAYLNPSVFGTLTLVNCSNPTPSLSFDLKAMLEGAYNPSTGNMRTNLYQLELLPGMVFTMQNQPGVETPPGQPYSIAPWNYPGTEGQTFSNSDYDATNVDWVLMSLRTGVDQTTEIHHAAGILRRDGTIEFLPGSDYQGNEPGPFYILLEHRNHMGVLTPQPLTPQNGVLVHDFTTQDSWVSPNGGFGQKQLMPGLWGLYAADGDQISDPVSYDINGADRIFWSIDNGIFNEYRGSDFDLSGEISGADRILWERNTGFSSGVPK